MGLRCVAWLKERGNGVMKAGKVGGAKKCRALEKKEELLSYMEGQMKPGRDQAWSEQ